MDAEPIRAGRWVVVMGDDGPPGVVIDSSPVEGVTAIRVTLELHGGAQELSASWRKPPPPGGDDDG